ncbi:hypothetical protein R6Q57_009270 [Mikania cordata]
MKKRKSLSQVSANSRRKRQETIVHTYAGDMYLYSGELTDQSVVNMEESVAAVESILMYKFNDKRLLEEALTHSSYNGSPSYQRLEFLGDSVLQLAISNFFFLTYDDVEAGQLSLLRSANISTEKLARVAVRHGLYKYIRHNKAGVLSEKVREFLIAVEEEGEMVVHGGQMKPPKVLADIVESVAAAVYVDCGFNLQMVWMIFRSLLEPLVMLNVVLAQPQPVTALFEACHKDGKQVDIRHQWKGDRSIASVFVDDTFIAFGSSVTKDNAKIHAAKAALSKITKPKSDDKNSHANVDLNHLVETEGAKQKVCQICNKKKWPKPTYRIEQELGPAHDKRYISTVQVELADAILLVKGNERSRVKDAENSAAAMMLTALRESGYA